jgi:hypothetical protein
VDDISLLQLALPDPALPVFLSGANLLMPGKDLDNSQVLSFFQQVHDQALA